MRRNARYAQRIRDRVALVTGGAGLVGSHVTEQLLAAGAQEVRVLDDFSRGTMANLQGARKDPRLRVIKGDIRDRHQVRSAMEGAQLVFHQAAIRITRCATENRLALDVLVGGTFNVIEAAKDLGVSKLVAASSASIYGQATSFPTTEEHDTYANRTLYGACKVANEQMLRAFSEMSDLPYIALRYFNVYGPRMDVFGAYTEVLIRWMDQLDSGSSPKIFGDGLQTMDFVYVEDVARANLAAARADVADTVYNVASGRETSLRELCSELARVMGKPCVEPDYLPLPQERRGVEIRRRLADVSKARAEIGFAAETSLAQGLSQLLAWRAAERKGLASSPPPTTES